MRWLAPLLLLQALVRPPAPLERCVDLPPDLRAACETQQMDTAGRGEEGPILPPRTEPPRPDEEVPQTGDQFSSPRTFTGEEEGSPAF
jgi:hypothetical protein